MVNPPQPVRPFSTTMTSEPFFFSFGHLAAIFSLLFILIFILIILFLLFLKQKKTHSFDETESSTNEQKSFQDSRVAQYSSTSFQMDIDDSLSRSTVNLVP